MKIGVAAIRGTYQGKVKIHSKDELNSYQMTVEGKGPAGQISGDARIEPWPMARHAGQLGRQRQRSRHTGPRRRSRDAASREDDRRSVLQLPGRQGRSLTNPACVNGSRGGVA